MVIVYGLAPLYTYIFHRNRPLPLSWQHIMFWGGQRGAVSLASVLSLPADLPQRDSLLTMTYAVVMFTSWVQATSMPWHVQELGADTKKLQRADIPSTKAQGMVTWQN